MKNYRQKVLCAIVGILFVVGLVAYWPVALFAALAAAVGGYPLCAAVLGLILDIAYGAPAVPFLDHIGLPFTAAVVAIIILKYLGMKFFGAENFDRV